MKYTSKVYAALFLIVVISLVAMFAAPISEFYKGILSIPGAAALMGAVYQIFIDQSSYEKSVKLQESQQLFNLGAMSHMANTVFDKHVEFSEKYLSEVHNTVVVLTREGPTSVVLDNATRLYSIRIDYSAWITPELESKLDPFESAVRRIGAKSGYVNDTRGDEKSREKRGKAIEEMHDIFENLMDFEIDGPRDELSSVKAVKEQVRIILGVSELVMIREYLVKQATEGMGEGC